MMLEDKKELYYNYILIINIFFIEALECFDIVNQLIELTVAYIKYNSIKEQ